MEGGEEIELLIIAALPSEARLPNELISCRIDHLPRMTGTMQATVMIFQLLTTAPMTMTNVMPNASDKCYKTFHAVMYKGS